MSEIIWDYVPELAMRTHHADDMRMVIGTPSMEKVEGERKYVS